MSTYGPSEELLDRLERVRVLLARAFEVRRALAGADPPPGVTTSTSSRPLERFLVDNIEPGFVPRSPEVEAALSAIERHVAERAAASGGETRFARLVRLLGLDEVEVDLLLAALAPGVRRGFREALLLLGPELAPGVHPAAHLVELVACSAESYARARAAVEDDGALLGSGALVAEAISSLGPPLWRALAPSAVARDWLVGRASTQPALDGNRPLGAVVDDSVAERLEAVATAAARVLLVGEPGSGRTRAATLLGRLLGREVALLDARSGGAAARSAILDARLRNRMLYLALPSSTPTDGTVILDPALLPLLREFDLPCAVAAPPRHAAVAALTAAGYARVEVPSPGAPAQIEAWRIGLGGALDEASLGELVRAHTLDLGAIESAAAQACGTLAGSPAAEDPHALLAAAERAARVATTHRLSDVADRLSTTLTWDDLVLPEEVRAAVDEVWRAASARRTVFERWGFDARTPYGRAISALFSGDPGTGKTMVATLIARQLGLELYRVDLSRLVDKYIGETEKHLATLFAEAERGRCAILFDEADSLFGKRTSKGDSSTERYANMEVNYLLQRIETFSGIALLTTNQESVMDAAFKRRIRYHVHFPFPTDEERARLWERLIPPEAPIDGELDVLALARRYEISGGHIKNAVLRAAFAAAAAGEALTQEGLLRAADQELENMGKLVGH